VVIVHNNQFGGHIDGSLDDRERHGTIVEVVARSRHRSDHVAVDHYRIAGLGENGLRTVKVQSDQSTRWVPDVVNLGHRLLSRVTPLGQMHGSSKPIEFVRKGPVVDLCHRWPSSDNAKWVNQVGTENVDARLFTGGQQGFHPRPCGYYGFPVGDSTRDNLWPRVGPREVAEGDGAAPHRELGCHVDGLDVLHKDSSVEPRRNIGTRCPGRDKKSAVGGFEHVNAVLDSSLAVEFEGVTRISDSETAQVLTERRIEDVEPIGSRDENNARLD